MDGKKGPDARHRSVVRQETHMKSRTRRVVSRDAKVQGYMGGGLRLPHNAEKTPHPQPQCVRNNAVRTTLLDHDCVNFMVRGGCSTTFENREGCLPTIFDM